MIGVIVVIALGLCAAWVMGFVAGFGAGKTEMLREELEYGEKLRAQIEAGIKPEERDLFDWDRVDGDPA